AGRIHLRLDPERLLPDTDPFGRQILIGSGAFLELLRMAAAEQGLAADISLFPEGQPQPKLDRRPFATIALAPVAPPRDPLFAHALK
ncbi:twin-arginine translocation pathway signal protein, partial [Pseudomonas sp. FW306-02-H06C]